MSNKVVPEGSLIIDRLKEACKGSVSGRVSLSDFKLALSRQHRRRAVEDFGRVVTVSEAEELFAMHLRRKRIGFVQQFEVEGFVSDFMIPDYGVLVEIDGFNHFIGDNEGNVLSKRSVQHHYDREKRFIMAGWRVLRFTSNEVYQDPEDAVFQLLVLLDWLDENKPVVQSLDKERVVERVVEVPVEKVVVREVVKESGLDSFCFKDLLHELWCRLIFGHGKGEVGL